MAKQDKEQLARMQGMEYALKIVKRGGVAALEKEIKLRNFINIPLNYTKKELNHMYRTISSNVYVNILTAMLYALHDSMGFGKQRLIKVMEAFDKAVKPAMDLDYMGQHYVRLSDYAVELNQKYNLGIDINRVAAVESENDEADPRTKLCDTKRVIEILRMEGYHKAAGFLERKLD